MGKYNMSSKYIKISKFLTCDKLIISRKEIIVDISLDKDSILLESEYLNIYVCGKSFNEALNRFSEQVSYFFDYYHEKPDSEVTGMAANLKEIFNNRFYLA